ncbi:MAG: CoA-binding protein [Dehalococcoidales bacterium]|nr:MAG: CoA-binding protein [Dehalococcoidales bacterium]
MKIDSTKLDRAFNPQCVAVVGDSKQTNFEWLRGQLEFTGKLYSVQVNPDTIPEIKALGVENYTSLIDIPKPVDLVIVAVSRTVAPRVLEDCIKKDVAAAHFFTAGFSETHTEEGVELERMLKKRAEEANLHLIGPNCMGIFNPKLGIKQSDDQYTDGSGLVGFISQSGALAVTFSLEAHLQGLDINKSVSSGNGIVLDATDFLEYLGGDTEVKAIGMYIEGVNDGRKFFETLKQVAERKPVVIWKGGHSEDGDRAIASHTGALAASRTVWDTMVRQCGAVAVSGTEQLIDTLKAIIYLPSVKGNRVAVAGGSGGQSVAITDSFAEVGLRVPPLTQESYDELATFFNVVGGSYRNPIDTAGPVRRDMRRILEIVERDANIDNLVLICSTKPGRQMMPAQLQGSLELASHIKERTAKPVMVFVFLFTPDADREKRDIIFRYQEIGIPAFPSIERGVIALKNALDYHHLHDGK